MKLLQEVDISRTIRGQHPDIKTDGTKYLVKFNSTWHLGSFTKEWYGLNFTNWGTSGRQLDAPGYNGSTWERIIEINLDLL